MAFLMLINSVALGQGSADDRFNTYKSQVHSELMTKWTPKVSPLINQIRATFESAIEAAMTDISNDSEVLGSQEIPIRALSAEDLAKRYFQRNSFEESPFARVVHDTKQAVASLSREERYVFNALLLEMFKYPSFGKQFKSTGKRISYGAVITISVLLGLACLSSRDQFVGVIALFLFAGNFLAGGSMLVERIFKSEIKTEKNLEQFQNEMVKKFKIEELIQSNERELDEITRSAYFNNLVKQ